MKRNFFTLLSFLIVFLMTSQLSAQVGNCEGASCDGPIDITSFADSTNITAGDGFPREFHRGDTVHIIGIYENDAISPDSLWATHDVYAADWSGLEYEGVPQIIANKATGVGTVDGVIDFKYVIPDDAPFFGDFHDTTDTDAPIANHILQLRIAYPSELNLDVFWNIFIKVVPKEITDVEVAPCEGASCSGPIAITSFADSTNIMAGDGFPRQLMRGEIIKVLGMYGLNDVLQPDSIWITHDVYAADWSGLEYEGVRQMVFNKRTGEGMANGMIDFGYTIPEDAPFFGDFHDADDEAAPPANHIIQVRVAYAPELNLDVFWNIFVQVVPNEITDVEVAPCEGASCSGPIAITSFADSTNIMAGDGFPRQLMRGEIIKVLGQYGLNDVLQPDSVWITHDVYAADWSGLDYEGVPQMVFNKRTGEGTANGMIDFGYTIPEDAPFFGDFHDADDEAAPPANHIIQVRVAYAPELQLDVFWNIFIQVVPDEITDVEVAPCEGASCGGPIAITSFADSTNIMAGDGFPRELTRGEIIKVIGMYGLNDVLQPDSIWITHDVYAADWSGLDYEGVPQMVFNKRTGEGTANGMIDFDYTIPEDAPFFGDFHDTTDVAAPPANHIIQVRVAYPSELQLDVFWNIFIQVVDNINSTSQPVLHGLEVFPNPAKQEIFINTPENLAKQVQIFDLTGKLILQRTIRENRLDISELNAGFHIIRVQEDGKVASKKLIINR